MPAYEAAERSFSQLSSTQLSRILRATRSIEIKAGLYHVTLGGINRLKIFL